VEGLPSGFVLHDCHHSCPTSAAVAIAVTATAVLGRAMLFMELPDYQTVIGVVRVPLMVDAIPTKVSFIMLRAVAAPRF
jgi:hypothetical protein